MRWLRRFWAPPKPFIEDAGHCDANHQRAQGNDDSALLRALARIIQKMLEAENFPWSGEPASRMPKRRDRALFEADTELNAYWHAVIANGAIEEERRRIRQAHALEVKEIPIPMRTGTSTLTTIQRLIPIYRAWGRITLDLQAQEPGRGLDAKAGFDCPKILLQTHPNGAN